MGMSNIFLIADTHFGHANILKFTKEDGTLLRPGFDDIEHMNEVFIFNWNSVVKPIDKVYHLGDIGFKNATEVGKIMNRLHGEKVLIKGNHDNLKLSQYAQWFKDVRGTHQLAGFILSHIPIHPGSLARWAGNIHGHLHANKIKDDRYINVSVECINYTPIELNECINSRC